MAPLKHVQTAHLLPRVEALLLELLRGLEPAYWDRPTIAAGWSVKDVAGHLLDTAVRKLSVCRDGWAPAELRPHGGEELAAFINRLNREGTGFARRVSPRLLISLLETVSAEYVAYHQALDPLAEAAFAVSWAGETRSLNWFDTAREYTERWHHQQQIRLAVGKPGIETRDLYHPVLDTFMRALPHACREVERPPGTAARFTVSGEAGGTWLLVRGEDSWELTAEDSRHPASDTTIPQSIAWRLFTKGIDRREARAQIAVTGDAELGLAILHTVAIVG